MRTFGEFKKINLVKIKQKDEARARNLIESAEKRKKVTEKYLPLNEETAVQVMEECYDVIRELLEAKLSREGYKSYSHEAVVSYMTELGFQKDKVVFLDELREIRHGTKYYGKTIDIEYAKKVKSFLDEIFTKLKKIASE